MELHQSRSGSGKPLILIHGLGSSSRSWDPLLEVLGTQRELIAIDLPGHGKTPPEEDSDTFAGLVRSFGAWLEREELDRPDMVGSSMGARLVLEMARLGRSGAAVALNPGGFWAGWERAHVSSTLHMSVLMLRGLRAALPALSRNVAARSALLAQLSARPWDLNAELVARELQSFAGTQTFDALLKDLAYGPPQEGPKGPGAGRLTIGWGRHDRLCLPVQAGRAIEAFPDADLVWFERSGHFPMWDEPEAAARTILKAVA